MQNIPLLNESQICEEYNRLSSFELCINSQELVQELVSKTSELVSIFRVTTLSLIHADQSSFLNKKAKIEDTLKTFDFIFLRLRTISKILHERKRLIEGTKTINGSYNHENLEVYKQEKENLISQIRNKNKYIKEAIDRVSDIIWQINSVQTLKH